MGRPVQPICPRCKLRPKVAGKGYCHACAAAREAERRQHDPQRSRDSARRWQARNAESVRARNKAWAAANRARRNAYRRKRRHENPERARAREAVKYALRTGKLVRPARCERCKRKCKPEAHHHDYAKKLDVEWICPTCHGKEHRK